MTAYGHDFMSLDKTLVANTDGPRGERPLEQTGDAPNPVRPPACAAAIGVTTVRRIETEVLVVGGGPVGLTLAMDLAWRRVGVTIAEARRRGEPPSVKCNHVSARSMEIFRRLGVAGKLRDAGLPPDFPNDVVYRTTATGMELAAGAPVE